jgi:LPS O-antigen subunit length determinant protein (WzzB/FepE family)
MADNSSCEEGYVDDINFSSIFAVLWKQRKLIIYGTLGATLLSLGISFLLPKVYRSEGFFQFGNATKIIAENEKLTIKKTPITAAPPKKTAFIGIPVQLYKSNSPQFFNPNRFQFIAGQEKSFGDEELNKIRDKFKTATDINNWIKPVYAFAKEDAREFAQLPQDESNAVLGLNLAYEADSPENAFAYVNFFGNYIRDCLLYVTLYNYIMDGYSSTVAGMNKIENEIIGVEFELLQNTNKMKDIRAILSNYPESAKMESRQLVSVQEGGSRFLAPVTQLVGIESALADLRRDLAELQRTKDKLSLRAEYFSRSFNELIENVKQGEKLFLMLKKIKDDSFAGKDLNKDEVKEVFNDLSIDLQTFDFTFFQNSRFISGPTIPTVPIKPQKTLIIIVTFITSLFLLIVSVFISHWWQNNKKAIMSDSLL